MHGARVQFQIAPSRRGIITFRIGTVESEENERFLHHVLRLEKDGQFGVFVGDHVGGVGCKVGVGRGGEDDRRLGFLCAAAATETKGRSSIDRSTSTRAAGEWRTAHLAKRTFELLVQRAQAQRTHVARAMVARGEGVVLDGFGAYPADGHRGVLVVVGGGIGACGGGVDVGGGVVGGRMRCGSVCQWRGRGLIAAASRGFGGICSAVAATTASASAIASSVAVLRWASSSFGGRRGRHGVR